MSAVPPGWHPDPSNPGGAVRWWDGTAWTGHTQPLPVAAPAPTLPQQASFAPPGPAIQPASAVLPTQATPSTPHAPYAPPAPAPAAAPGYLPGQPAGQVGFAKRNALSLTAAGVVAVYVVLALATHVVLLGIFPVLLSVRAIRAKEQLAPVAVVAAVIAVGVAFVALR